MSFERIDQLLVHGESDSIEFEQRYNGYGFDHLPRSDVGLDELDIDLLYKTVKTANTARNSNINIMLPPELILENLDLASGNVLTNAAILLFGKRPQHYFSNHFEIKSGLFSNAISFDNIINDKEFSANLLENFLFAYNFVLDTLKVHSEIVDEKRIDTLEFPASVIREAIVNMIVHRDYRVDIKSSIEIRPEKISFYNPAHLFTPAITIEKLKQHHVSRTGNKLIAKIFYMLGYFENWGSGTLKIVDDTRNAGKPEPEFRFQDGIFELVLWR